MSAAGARVPARRRWERYEHASGLVGSPGTRRRGGGGRLSGPWPRTVGAGGPGPALQLTSLRRIDGTWGWVWDDDEDRPWLLDSSGPFVETEDWADRQTATLRAAGYEPTTRDEDDDYLDDYRKAFGDAGDEAWHLERGRGAIHISANGCVMTGWLIVVGPHSRELRDRACAVNPPFEPYVDARGNRHTFRTWYLEWLERRETATRWPRG
ncbi:hypothetical protein [Kitasatospora sp. NPDC093102]|uniref:hypothetical protein n=1 Tax=Kitasatospora sp. NPDC093102 TaxID=3155069 RepID=UPI00341E3897